MEALHCNTTHGSSLALSSAGVAWTTDSSSSSSSSASKEVSACQGTYPEVLGTEGPHSVLQFDALVIRATKIEALFPGVFPGPLLMTLALRGSDLGQSNAMHQVDAEEAEAETAAETEAEVEVEVLPRHLMQALGSGCDEWDT